MSVIALCKWESIYYPCSISDSTAAGRTHQVNIFLACVQHDMQFATTKVKKKNIHCFNNVRFDYGVTLCHADNLCVCIAICIKDNFWTTFDN